MITVRDGVILGTLVQGLPLTNGYYVGGTFDWVNPFALLITYVFASDARVKTQLVEPDPTFVTT